MVMLSGVFLAGTGFALAMGAGTLDGGRATQPPADAQAGAPDMDALGVMLMRELGATEGCLGHTSGLFDDSWITIIAWFENKAAVERWVRSPTHARIMSMTGADPERHVPLRYVTDEEAPVMVMASINIEGPPALPGSPIPFHKISIEMFTPLPGGAAINGRLSPDPFHIPHFRRLETGAGD